MSEPIKVGDLVQVVRFHCDLSEKYLGRIFTVESITWRDCECAHCNEHIGPALCAHANESTFYLTGWLKRIPPLEELESTKHTEELTA